MRESETYDHPHDAATAVAVAWFDAAYPEWSGWRATPRTAADGAVVVELTPPRAGWDKGAVVRLGPCDYHAGTLRFYPAALVCEWRSGAHYEHAEVRVVVILPPDGIRLIAVGAA